jgi:chromosome segregation ATPase
MEPESTPVRQAAPPIKAEAGLDNTDELRALDVAAYEAQLLAGNLHGESSEPQLPAADPACSENRPQSLAELPPPEFLRDIEAWIAAQDARARSYDRALAELKAARTDAQARADTLALELEIAKKALHTALCRANDGERAALDNGAAMQAAESRAAGFHTQLEEVRRELATAAGRIAAVTAELTRTNESLAAKAREQQQMQLRQDELARTLDERAHRVTQLEGELAELRAHIAQADRELAQRAERMASVQQDNETRQAAANAIARERDALAGRIARLIENAQSSESKRNVWEGMWRGLDAELTEARASLARLEAERAELAATVTTVSAGVADRDAAIARLEAERAAQGTALAELAATRVREQKSQAASTQELRTRAETLAAGIKVLDERLRRSAESLAAREADLAESRATHAALEETLRTAQSSNTAHAARTAELEVLTTDLSQALQTQTEGAQRARGLCEDRERELADEHARAAALEEQLQATMRHASERSTSAESTENALRMHVEQLAASQERVANLEHDALEQSERIASLQAQLAHARSLAEQAAAARGPVESELGRVRAELQHEAERAGTLDAAQRKLALDLERTRGALGERELQLRRLERYANSSTQVLSRIKRGIERGSAPPVEAVRLPDGAATFIPLDNSDAPPLTLGLHTTIGRAPESDLCLKDSSISRRHAVLTIGPNGAFIEDLHSVNGITVNRQRVRQARLTDGDVVELGLRRFRFTQPAARAADAG